MLVTLIGGVHRPGVYEIEIGQPVGEMLELAGGPEVPLSALLIGGYFGTWADPEAAWPLPFSADGLSAVGASPGAGLIAALPADSCGLAETARVARYLAGESAGQCGPCVFGLDAIAGALEDLAAGRSFQPGPAPALDGPGGRPRCLSPSGRRGPPDPQRAEGVRRGDRPARSGPVLREPAAWACFQSRRGGSRDHRRCPAAGRPDRMRRPRPVRGGAAGGDHAR